MVVSTTTVSRNASTDTHSVSRLNWLHVSPLSPHSPHTSVPFDSTAFISTRYKSVQSTLTFAHDNVDSALPMSLNIAHVTHLRLAHYNFYSALLVLQRQEAILGTVSCRVCSAEYQMMTDCKLPLLKTMLSFAYLTRRCQVPPERLRGFG